MYNNHFLIMLAYGVQFLQNYKHTTQPLFMHTNIWSMSVHLTTLFPGQAEQAVNQYFVHKLSLVTDNNPS